MRIGILSDTHLPNTIRDLSELGPEPTAFFSSTDLILHGGDLTSPIVLDWLEQFAPVLCSTGNNDPIPDRRCQDVQIIDIEGWRIGLVHALGPRNRPVQELQKAFPSSVDIMISGHTHQEVLEYREGVVMLNSGSVTFPRNMELRLGAVGLLELTPGKLQAEIQVLGHTPGMPNPSQGMALRLEDGVPIASDGATVNSQERQHGKLGNT